MKNVLCESLESEEKLGIFNQKGDMVACGHIDVHLWVFYLRGGRQLEEEIGKTCP